VLPPADRHDNSHEMIGRHVDTVTVLSIDMICFDHSVFKFYAFNNSI